MPPPGTAARCRRARFSPCLLILLALLASPAQAQQQQQIVPGSADAGRITPDNKLPAPAPQAGTISGIPQSTSVPVAPESAKGVSFVLKNVVIEGATAFTPSQLRDIYAAYEGREVTLDVAWLIAGGITERYRHAGYFLSRAYIPAQKIDSGTLTVRVVEGYVAKVKINNEGLPRRVGSSVLDSMTAGLKAQHPLRIQDLESFLLRVNDMPGVTFRAVLSQLNGDAASKSNADTDGGVLLTLVPETRRDTRIVSFDNSGSRFLGPNELTATYQTSLLPLQQTTVSVLSTLPADELNYFFLQHKALIAPSITLDLDGSFTQARPGYTLEPLEIRSRATWLKAGLSWQWIRQRDENLALSVSLDGRNTNSNFVGIPLTRDRIRTVRLGVAYDFTDAWQGNNTADFTLTRGLNIFGSSEAGDPNLSRAKATPDFTTAQLSFSRTQALPAAFSLYGAVTGQLASNTLYSAEEFGYGGKAFGRAYDASEITGDQGASGSVELRYNRYNRDGSFGVIPYGFYDIGAVWDKGSGASAPQSGSSAGFGLRFRAGTAVYGDIGLAFPLTRSISAPIYGQDKGGPRPLFQITAAF